MTRPMRRVTVVTHRRPQDIASALAQLRHIAAEAGVELCFDEAETRKHGLENGAGLSLQAPVGCEADLCLVLGGDGTILQALRTYLGTGTPVFAVNYGEVGFLATAEPDDVPDAFRRALAVMPKLGVRRLITARFPLEKIEDAFAHAAAGHGVKTVIVPNAI